jgi:hypothetical protein
MLLPLLLALSTAQYLSNLPVARSGSPEPELRPLRYDGTFGYLPDLLRQLEIDASSQMLVFSRTSFQAAKVSPENPRAIYFNDRAAVGWVPGAAKIEVALQEPGVGTVFYTLDADSGSKLERQQGCLQCHQGPATLGVPGMFVGSVIPDATGKPQHDGAIITDHRTPFADRWGGWYVNARRGQQLDRSNAIAPDPAEPLKLDTLGKQNLPELPRKLKPYLAASSDIVALMVFEHQTYVANLLTRFGQETRLGLQTTVVDQVVDGLFFVDEAPLREPIEGISEFAKTFALRGPLREFDLKTRLFRYRLSYMIYSPLFDGLPDSANEQLRTRIRERLAALPADERAAIRRILQETKPRFL